MAKPLTIKEAKFIEGHQGLMSMSAIARLIGRDKNTVSRYLQSQGLHTPGKHGGNSTFHKKGSHHFQKGHEGRNKLPVGTIRKRFNSRVGHHLMIKTEGGWRKLSLVLVEESLERKLTGNERVIHIDGNPLNCSIENLKVAPRAPKPPGPDIQAKRRKKAWETRRANKKNPPTPLSSTVSGMNKLMFGFDLNRKGA